MATAPLLSAALLAATKSTTSTGSSAASFIFLLVIVGLVLVFFRSRSSAARRQRETLMDLTPGDEVLTGAGIFGTVLDVASDRVTLETAPGTRITVVRSTIARRIAEQPGSDGWSGGEGPEAPAEIEGPGHERGADQGDDEDGGGTAAGEAGSR